MHFLGLSPNGRLRCRPGCRLLLHAKWILCGALLGYRTNYHQSPARSRVGNGRPHIQRVQLKKKKRRVHQRMAHWKVCIATLTMEIEYSLGINICMDHRVSVSGYGPPGTHIEEHRDESRGRHSVVRQVEDLENKWWDGRHHRHPKETVLSALAQSIRK